MAAKDEQKSVAECQGVVSPCERTRPTSSVESVEDGGVVSLDPDDARLDRFVSAIADAIIEDMLRTEGVDR
jgi:hypothetical protein